MRRGNTPGTGKDSAPYMYRGKATLTRVASDDARTAVPGMLTLAGSIVYNVIRSGSASPGAHG